MKRPSLPALQAFRRVVELQSFGAAGRSLGITGGAVSKLVAQLESDLGVRLLHRTTRSLSVSSEGTQFYEAAARVLDELDAAADAARGQQGAPAARLRVSVPTSFALARLAPRLPAFVREHPQLELDLMLNDRFVDIVHEGFDCAIRIAARLPDSSLMARPLGRVQRWLVASPAYLEVAPPLQRPQDLASHACLVYSQQGGPPDWVFAGGESLQPTNPLVTTNNSVMLRELLLDGLGVTLTPEFVVGDLVASGRLVELLPRHRAEALTVFGVVAHPRQVPRKVALLLEFVAGLLRPPR